MLMALKACIPNPMISVRNFFFLETTGDVFNSWGSFIGPTIQLGIIAGNSS